MALSGSRSGTRPVRVPVGVRVPAAAVGETWAPAAGASTNSTDLSKKTLPWRPVTSVF